MDSGHCLYWTVSGFSTFQIYYLPPEHPLAGVMWPASECKLLPGQKSLLAEYAAGVAVQGSTAAS